MKWSNGLERKKVRGGCGAGGFERGEEACKSLREEKNTIAGGFLPQACSTKCKAIVKNMACTCVLRSVCGASLSLYSYLVCSVQRMALETIAPDRSGWNLWRAWIGGDQDVPPEVFQVSHINLYVRRKADEVYVALYVTDLKHQLATINFTEQAAAHITIGTYIVDNRWPKMENKLKDAADRVKGWERLASMCDGMKIWLKTVDDVDRPVPAVFSLRLCQQGWALNHLVSQLEVLFSGSFKCTTHQPRTMLYRSGPTFHLSIYGDCTVDRH